MENQKLQRSSAEIQSEYQQLCTKAGHLQYSVSQGKKDLDLINDSLRQLQVEHSLAKKREEVAAKSAEVQG